MISLPTKLRNGLIKRHVLLCGMQFRFENKINAFNKSTDYVKNYEVESFFLSIYYTVVPAFVCP